MTHQYAWPLGLLLDEVWLKSRRNLIQSLENESLWIGVDEYRDFMICQGRLGTTLRKDILDPVLGDDSAILHSRAIFGKYNRRFRYRLPYTLAFGHELGYYLASVYGLNHDESLNIARLSSLFNTGISIVDLIVDCGLEQNKLSDWLPRDTMVKLATNECVEDYINQACEVEHRIALRVVSGFFQMLFSSTEDSDRITKYLMPALTRLYIAEENSVGNRTDCNGYTTSSSKSVGPFLFIEKMALVTRSKPTHKAPLTLGHKIGKTFWLLDDTVDLIDDYRNNSLNIILEKSKKKLEKNSFKYEISYQLLTEILEGKILDRTVKEILETIKTCLNLIQISALGKDKRDDFAKFYLVYIRDWMS
jgi:hypothetical protein